MGLQANETASLKDGNPAFLVDQDIGDTTNAHWAMVEGVSFQSEDTSIAFSPTHWLPASRTVRGSRGTSRVVAHASVAVGVCLLWLFIEAAGDKGLCDDSDTGAQALVAPTEKGRKIAQPNAMRDESSLVSRVVETTLVGQKQLLERGREKIDILADRPIPIQRSDAAQGKAAQAPQSAPAWERKQPLEYLEYGQEWDRAEVLGCAVASSLQGELDALRSWAEAARIKQRQALDQERGRADALARELTSLWAEIDTDAVQAPEAQIKQKQALEQERGRADTLARELTSLRAELDAARIAGPEAAKTAAAAVEQQQALKQELKQERDKAEAVARELTSLRAELDTARAAGRETTRTAEAVKIEQKLAFGKERDKAETFARELALARKEAEQRSALLAAAHAEMLQVTETNTAVAAEQKRALASERDRADALARELTSVKNELEAGNRQIAALNALGALRSREPIVDSARGWMAEHSSRTIAGKERLPEQISGEAVASTSGRSSASKLPRPEAQLTAREAAPASDPKVGMATERSVSAGAASHSPVDEQRLLARANALLRQADISGARPLLEHAREHGSARAAFMLAETYDARVLQSWGARGISGDLAKARELYEWAQAGGIGDAKERIEALKYGSARSSAGPR